MEDKKAESLREELKKLKEEFNKSEDYLLHLLRLLWLDIEQREEKIGTATVEIEEKELRRPLLDLYERFWTELIGPFGELYLILYSFWRKHIGESTETKIATVSRGELTKTKRDFICYPHDNPDSLFQNVKFPILSISYFVSEGGDIYHKTSLSSEWSEYENILEAENKEVEKYQLQRYKIVLTDVEIERIKGEEKVIEVAVGMFIAYIADIAHDEDRKAEIRDKLSQLGEIPHNVRQHICDPLRKAIEKDNKEWASRIMDYLHARTVYLEFLAKEDEFKKNPGARKKFQTQHFSEWNLIDIVRHFIELRLFPKVKEEKKWNELFKDCLEKLDKINEQEKEEYKCWTLRSAIETVLENITSNAIRWGFNYDIKKDHRIDIAIKQDNKWIHISFKDTGQGFDEETKNNTEIWMRYGQFEKGGNQGMGMRSIHMALDSVKGKFDDIDWGQKDKNSRYHPTFRISLPKPYPEEWELGYSSWLIRKQKLAHEKDKIRAELFN